MKNRIITTLVFSLSLISFSCSDSFLDTAPTGSVDASAAYATTKNAKAAINGIYRALVVRYQASQGHFGYPAIMIIMDVMGEDYVMGTTSNGWHFGEQRWVAHRSETNVMTMVPYELFYRVIGNANIALANIDNAAGPDAERNQVKGEALVLRAFAYFNLVQLYGKRYSAGAPNTQLAVPLVVSPTTVGQPRATVEEVYTQINADLDAALALLQSARLYKSHINLEVAKGFKARVALVQQNWAVAEQFANEARTGFALMNAAAYQTGFSDIANSEWMWGFDHLEDQSEFFGAYHSYISCNYNSSNIRLCPKAINSLTYNQIPATDVRKLMWVQAPTVANSIVPTGGVRVPYMTQKFKLPGIPSTSTQGDVPYMRSAEMYLIEAEAMARQGEDPGAAQVLFNLVSTRNPNYTLSANTGTALINEILLQRRFELWGEGHRFLDLKRLNAPLNRNGANHIAAVAVLFDAPAGDVKWEFLLPRAEINANKAIIQNPL